MSVFEKRNFDNALPEEMKNEGLFCLWKYVPKDGGLTKKPVNPNATRFGAKPNDKSTFAPFSEVVGRATYGYSKEQMNNPKAYGLGIGLFKDMSIGCIDLDHCLIDGKLSPLAEEVLRLTGETYTEISPSGEGLHVFFKFQNAPEGYGERGKGIECYLAGRSTRYMTVTGRSYREDLPPVLKDLSEVLPQIFEKYLKQSSWDTSTRDTSTRNTRGEVCKVIVPEDFVKRRIQKGYSVEDYGGDHSRADHNLCCALAVWTCGNVEQMDRIFRESDLMRDKWDVIHSADGKTYGQMTLENALNEYLETMQYLIGEFSATEAELHFDDFLQRIRGENYRPFPTGMHEVDRILGGGLILKNLIVLTAAPATGKTTLAQQIFETMGADTLFINLEMDEEQLLARSLSRMIAKSGGTMSAMDVLRGYSWTEEQRETVESVAREYRETVLPHMTYVHPETGNLNAIKNLMESYAESYEAEGKRAPFVVLDYLHLLSGDKNDDPQEVIKKTVKMLKDYAISHNSLVFLISATNRESNKSGRITLESGRDSSSIEYSADVQLAMNHWEVYKGDKSPSKPEDMEALLSQDNRHMVLQVLKNRLGPSGRTAELFFDVNGSRFYTPTFEDDGL